MDISIYAVPAILALIAKAAIYLYSRSARIHNVETRLYLFLLLAISIQGLAEVTFFMDRAKELVPTTGILYFAVSIVAIALILHLAITLSPHRLDQRYVVVALYIPVVVLEAILLVSKSMVLGFEPMQYSYTRLPGPHYFLFETYAVVCFSASIVLFWHGARSKVASIRLKNSLMLVGVIPSALLVILVVSLQHFGIRIFNTTVTLPLTVTFFLAVTAYATHQYRLFDIKFFIPWSKVRQRKTAFYERIKAVIAEIADMSSVHRIVQSLSAALHCPVVLVGGPQPVLAMAGEALGVARFPVDELKKIDRIVVANEIVEAMPATHALMKRHKVAAIVPFHPHSAAAASWMLLGEAFSEQVYSPLDFKVVENLFARLADHFLDKQLLLRSQLADAREEIHILHHRLATAWEQMETLRKKIGTLQQDDRSLRAHNAELVHRQLAAMKSEGWTNGAKNQTLEERVAGFETRLIAEALEHCGGDYSRAAEVLGVPLFTLHQKVRQNR
jgi:DNA-binding protein Fis